jgi:mono/diheme cytochrome c family protein
MRKAWLLVGLAIASACADETASPARVVVAAAAATAAQARAGSCARKRPQYFEAVSPALPSQPVVLVRAPGRTLALVADEDEHAIHTLDAGSLAELAVTPLDGAPAHLLALADGRVVATLRDAARVVVLEPAADPEAALETRCSATVASEPIAMARVGDSLAVTSGWGARLTMLSLDGLAERAVVALEREPRAVVASDDGATAWVTHAVGGRLSVVDVGAGSVRTVDLRVGQKEEDFDGRPPRKPRDADQGFALVKAVVEGGERLLVPLASVDTGAANAPISGGYGSDEGPRAVAPVVAALDAANEQLLDRSLFTARDFARAECILPRAALADGDHLFVACMGADVVLDLDARFGDPILAERHRTAVGAGPAGLALDGDHLFVLSAFAHELGRIDLQSGALVRAPLARREGSPITAQIARGRRLFHATDDSRISADGRACASCHPDGRDDGLVWTSPDGRRQTKLLAGQLATSAPYGWFGEHKTLESHVQSTALRLGGNGFQNGGKDAEDLAALVAYLRVLPAPNGAAPADERVARGRELFESDDQGCSSCHARGGSDGRTWDVGSGVRGERQATFDTPSLTLVGQSAPYFHDGRYATLRDVLRETDGRMGHTGSLAPTDLEALEAYLASL